MILFDLSNPVLVIIALFLAIILVVIARSAKRSFIASINLFIFLALIIVHAVQFMTVAQELYRNLLISIGYDFAFILVTFLGYLWIDDMQAKEKNIKSIDNSLDWFWNKV